MSPDGEHTRELRELEPNLMPRQLRALERVAARLADRRPIPEPAFVAALDDRIGELDDPDELSGGAVSSAWRLGSAACLAVGFALLGVAALLIAAGAPGGH